MQEHVTRAMVYYLAVLCVAKYRRILDSVGKDEGAGTPSDSLPTPGDDAGGGLDEGGQNNQISDEEKQHSVQPGEGGHRSNHMLEEGGQSDQTPREGGQSDQTPREGGQSDQTPREGGQSDQTPREGGQSTEQSDRRGIQRLHSVETDSSTTPDLDQAFRFPTPEEVGPESSVPSSVTFYTQAMDASEQIEVALKLVGPFLCRLLVANRSMLSRVLVGTDGRSLLTDGTIHTLSTVCMRIHGQCNTHSPLCACEYTDSAIHTLHCACEYTDGAIHTLHCAYLSTVYVHSS